LFGCTLVANPVLAAEATPKASVRLKVNGTPYSDGARIPARPGEKMALEANVMGGRRAWCMEPHKYANMGKNTVIESNDESGLVFTTGPGFRGIWKVASEEVSWLGQLTGETRADARKPTAELTVPQKPGDYILQVKATAHWHYDRHAQGNHVEQTEENQAEARYTIVVEAGAGVWFSSANIIASGTEDADLKFRLQSLQSAWDAASQDALDRKWPLVQSNLGTMKSILGQVQHRVDELKREKPGFSCVINLHGLPTDKEMHRLASLRKMAEEWKAMQRIASGNALSINNMLLDRQMLFSNNVLKSVFKNYLDWGSGIPGTNDLFGAVPTRLSALVIPSNVLDWYGEAQADASVLKNQAQTIQKLTALRAFYLERSGAFVEESKAIHAEIDKDKAVEPLATEARAILSGSGVAVWAAGR
jgi:hypothetical protein